MSSIPSKVVKRSLPSPTPPSLPLSPQQQHKSKPVPQLLVTRGQTINMPNFSFFADSEDAAERSESCVGRVFTPHPTLMPTSTLTPPPPSPHLHPHPTSTLTPPPPSPHLHPHPTLTPPPPSPHPHPTATLTPPSPHLHPHLILTPPPM